ncbi:MAG: tetratricopeptide repeat protein, partial [Desulfobacteraceae bacterium]
ITGAGVMIGTPEYMSPEQVEGKEVDQRSDIYSLGVILYEMVTGKVPFEGDTPFTVGVMHKSEFPQSPKEINSQISDELNNVILKCLEKNKDNRYQNAGDVRSELENIEKGVPTAEKTAPEKKPLTSREITVQLSLKKLLIPALIVIAIAIIGILVWQLMPQKEAVVAPKIENSIAVIGFKNQTGDPAYDYLQEVIPNLLITNLENTGLFYVATWERMQDIIKQMGIRQAEFINSDTGFELCRREGIEAIAIGTFSKAGDVFIMDVKVLDAQTKQTLKSTNTKGTGADSIFESQIDDLSREISLGLGAGLDKVEGAQLNIKGITTHSLEAYQYFLKGKEALNMAAWTRARENLERALEIDPAFGMSYVYLAWTYFEPLQEKPLIETIKKGLSLSDGISQKDKLYLDGLYAYFVEQDVAKAVTHLDELLQKYPDEKWALHVSGDFARRSGDLEGALTRYKQWLELDLQDANALWHFAIVCLYMGDREIAEQYIKMHEAVAPPEQRNLVRQAMIYRFMGQVDKAIAKWKEILEVYPDEISPMRSLVDLYTEKEDYEEALRWANRHKSRSSTPGQRMSSYYELGYIHFMKGAFNDALAYYDRAIENAEQHENFERKSFYLAMKGFLYHLRADFEASSKAYDNMLWLLTEHEIELPSISKVSLAFNMGLLALDKGRIDDADTFLLEIKSLLPDMVMENAALGNLLMDLLQGEVLLARGDFDKALEVGKRACGPESPYWIPGQFLYEYEAYFLDLTARIYARMGDVGKAISEYERLLKTNYSTGFSFPINPIFRYRLGLLYERANEASKAKAEFEKFLDLWKDADPEIAEVEDAKKRLAGLKGQ